MRSSLAAFLRCLIGLVLVTTAIGKLLDNRGFAEVIGTYQVFPGEVLLGLGLGISLAELALGILLFTGRDLVMASFFALVMHLAYAVWSASGVLRGLKLPNCECFGVFLARPLGWATVNEDLVMSGLCLVLLVLARGSSRTTPRA